MEAARLQDRLWTKDEYFISTDPALVPSGTLNNWLASREMHWALPMPDAVLRETLQHSLCFGLYEIPHGAPPPSLDGLRSESPLVGFARCVTDFTSFAYLTDVYVEPRLRGKRLGTWLVECVQEVLDSMPYLRRTMLLTSDWARSVPFYEKLMEVEVLECTTGKGVAVMSKRGPGHPDYRG